MEVQSASNILLAVTQFVRFERTQLRHVRHDILNLCF